MYDKKINLLFAIDRNCIHLLKSCMWSVYQKSGADSYNVFVLHSDLEDEHKDTITEEMPFDICWSFIEVPEGMFEDFAVTKRYPKQIYYRLAAAELLPGELDRVLYLDVDIIVINSLMELYGSDFEGSWFMGCTNTGHLLTKFNQVRLGVDITKEMPYINTGVLLMNLKSMREHLDLNDIKKFARDKKNALILPDQDILTALYGDKVKLLDNMIYNLSDRTLALYNAKPKSEKRDLRWVREHTAIIHYFGSNKPWRDGYSGILNVLYEESEKDRKEHIDKKSRP